MENLTIEERKAKYDREHPPELVVRKPRKKKEPAIVPQAPAPRMSPDMELQKVQLQELLDRKSVV